MAPEEAGKSATRELFQRYCVKCHGTDGTGSLARKLQPAIPDFTAASWQARRKDAQLQASILDGKGDDMPSFRGKCKEDQVRDLVAYVRAFAPSKSKPGGEKTQEPISVGEFEKEVTRLLEEMDELKREFRERSQGSAGVGENEKVSGKKGEKGSGTGKKRGQKKRGQEPNDIRVSFGS